MPARKPVVAQMLPHAQALRGSPASFAHDFARTPIWAGQAPASLTAQVEEEGPGPVSQSSLIPAPPACTVTTRTLLAAPDGTASTRRTVGINEQVELTASAASAWTASAGTLSATSGTTVTWTAPSTGATSRITATPPAATGSPCTVSIRAIPPSRRSLSNPPTPRSYSAGLAGSGFVADVTILPTNVSFSRIEVREEAVAGVATGYYKDVLGWDGLMHPAGGWIVPNASNGGMRDTVGTNPPGSPGPFSSGDFLWSIPQHYRILGSSGGGTFYSTGNHIQIMGGSSGREGTGKEGAVNTRMP
jgi:hypothetical protein